MRSKGCKAKKQSKLMYIICAPIRIYMRSIVDCSGNLGYGGRGVSGYTASQIPRLPKSFSVNSAGSCDEEDLRQLLRTASSKGNNAENENNKNSTSNSDMQGRPIMIRQQTMNNGMGRRSYSVGLKMGRIDEEMACSFREDELNVKATLYS